MTRTATFNVLVLAVLVAASPLWAAPSEHLDWGAELHSGAAACPGGTLLVNVVQKVVNSVDSGTTRPVWAFVDYVRQIRVVDTGEGYCATVTYQGDFSSLAGDSPGASTNAGATIGDGVVGTFHGGYVSTIFTGTLKASPDRRTRGSIGTDDYQCDSSGACDGWVDWTTFYFDSVSEFALAWWGWVYHAGNNGSWTNAISGNSGDITGN